MNSAEIIKQLATELAQAVFNEELNNCKTLEDFEKLREKYNNIIAQHTH